MSGDAPPPRLPRRTARPPAPEPHRPRLERPPLRARPLRRRATPGGDVMSPRPPFLLDLARFVFSGRRLWLLPIALVLLLVSLLAAVGALTPYSVFLYPL